MTFKIQDNGLIPDIDFLASPNHGGKIDPKFIVIHYTAGPSLKSAVESLSNPKRQASAHFVIDKDGSIVQLVRCNERAWHAGESRYKYQDLEGRLHEYVGMNKYSIGIEFVNAGKLLKAADGEYETWYGEGLNPEDAYIDPDYYIPSKYQGQSIHKVSIPFERYTSFQIDKGLELCKAIIGKYGILDILGHSDIAIPEGRKIDPGPAFPMKNFRSALFSRTCLEDINEVA